jgi:hypothetical protein
METIKGRSRKRQGNAMEPKTHDNRLEIRKAVPGEAHAVNIFAELDKG